MLLQKTVAFRIWLYYYWNQAGEETPTKARLTSKTPEATLPGAPRGSSKKSPSGFPKTKIAFNALRYDRIQVTLLRNSRTTQRDSGFVLLTLLGSTGSIGTSTLDVVRRW